MRIFAIVLGVALILLQYRLWISDQGLREVSRLQVAVDAQASANREQGARNRQLVAEVTDLKIGLTALEHKPLGIGYNNFRFYLANHPTTGVSQILAHSHRLPVQIGLDAGWLGLAGFLLLFVGAAGAAIRAGP